MVNGKTKDMASFSELNETYTASLWKHPACLSSLKSCGLGETFIFQRPKKPTRGQKIHAWFPQMTETVHREKHTFALLSAVTPAFHSPIPSPKRLIKFSAGCNQTKAKWGPRTTEWSCPHGQEKLTLPAIHPGLGMVTHHSHVAAHGWAHQNLCLSFLTKGTKRGAGEEKTQPKPRWAERSPHLVLREWWWFQVWQKCVPVFAPGHQTVSANADSYVLSVART